LKAEFFPEFFLRLLFHTSAMFFFFTRELIRICFLFVYSIRLSIYCQYDIVLFDRK